MKLNRYFREHKTFPHPNITIELGRKYHSVFLDTFPELEIKLRQWTSKNLAKVRVKNVKNFIDESLIPEMYKTYLKESQQANNHLDSVGDFLEEFGISKKGVSHTTTTRWLHELGYEYKERKKSYFTDRHESEKNVRFREEFVTKYFEAELNTYRWVHLKEDVAKKMEAENGLMGIYHGFLNEQNEKMREYHIDIHKKLNEFPLTLSVRRPPSHN